MGRKLRDVITCSTREFKIFMGVFPLRLTSWDLLIKSNQNYEKDAEFGKQWSFKTLKRRKELSIEQFYDSRSYANSGWKMKTDFADLRAARATVSKHLYSMREYIMKETKIYLFTCISLFPLSCDRIADSRTQRKTTQNG